MRRQPSFSLPSEGRNEEGPSGPEVGETEGPWWPTVLLLCFPAACSLSSWLRADLSLRGSCPHGPAPSPEWPRNPADSCHRLHLTKQANRYSISKFIWITKITLTALRSWSHLLSMSCWGACTTWQDPWEQSTIMGQWAHASNSSSIWTSWAGLWKHKQSSWFYQCNSIISLTTLLDRWKHSA